MNAIERPRTTVVLLALVGGALLVGITIQALIVGIVSPVQPILGTVGLLVLALAVALHVTGD